MPKVITVIPSSRWDKVELRKDGTVKVPEVSVVWASAGNLYPVKAVCMGSLESVYDEALDDLAEEYPGILAEPPSVRNGWYMDSEGWDHPDGVTWLSRGAILSPDWGGHDSELGPKNAQLWERLVRLAQAGIAQAMDETEERWLRDEAEERLTRVYLYLHEREARKC